MQLRCLNKFNDLDLIKSIKKIDYFNISTRSSSQPLTSSQNINNPFNIQQEKQLVEKSNHGSIGWAKHKDINLLYNIIANDTSFLEFYPDESCKRISRI